MNVIVECYWAVGTSLIALIDCGVAAGRRSVGCGGVRLLFVVCSWQVPWSRRARERGRSTARKGLGLLNVGARSLLSAMYNGLCTQVTTHRHEEDQEVITQSCQHSCGTRPAFSLHVREDSQSHTAPTSHEGLSLSRCVLARLLASWPGGIGMSPWIGLWLGASNGASVVPSPLPSPISRLSTASRRRGPCRAP